MAEKKRSTWQRIKYTVFTDNDITEPYFNVQVNWIPRLHAEENNKHFTFL